MKVLILIMLTLVIILFSAINMTQETSCTHYARLHQYSEKQIVNSVFTLKAEIINTGDCEWKGWKLVSLNSGIEIPLEDVKPTYMASVKLRMMRPADGKYVLDMALVDEKGDKVLFENTPDGLMHWEFISSSGAQW